MEIIYFELNNWSYGIDYPAAEPFVSWIGGLIPTLRSDSWAKENKLCIMESNVDMSMNFCITASKEWVEKTCPKLLTEYSQFLRKPDEYGDVEGRFGCPFLKYEEYNFGVSWWSEYEDEYDDSDDEDDE